MLSYFIFTFKVKIKITEKGGYKSCLNKRNMYFNKHMDYVFFIYIYYIFILYMLLFIVEISSPSVIKHGSRKNMFIMLIKGKY